MKYASSYQMERINLFAANSSSGEPVFEEVIVESCGASRYRLLASPGLVVGVAAGDVISVDSSGRFTIVERGRNICIQIFTTGNVDQLERAATMELQPLGGRRDGKAQKLVVYTVPVDAGFERLEIVLRRLAKEHPPAEWYYGNVYDPSDGVTPLNWW